MELDGGRCYGRRVNDRDLDRWYVLLAEVPRQNAQHEIAEGLIIRSIEERLTTFDLAAVGAAGCEWWGLLQVFAPSCVSEVETAQSAGAASGYDALHRGWLLSTMLLMRGFTRHLPLATSRYSWSEVAGFERRNRGSSRRLPPFEGRLLELQTRVVQVEDFGLRPFGDADAAWIAERFETFNRLAAESHRFRFALEAVANSGCRGSSERHSRAYGLESKPSSMSIRSCDSGSQRTLPRCSPTEGQSG